MPLSKGKSKRTHSKNVSELMSAYKKTGKIGSSKPKSLAHAIEIANAIAYRKARGKKR